MSAVRLATVIPDLAVGGLQAMAVDLIAALNPAVFEPRVYTFDAEGPLVQRLDDLGIPHSHRPRGDGVSPGYAGELAADFARDGIDLVHCHNITALFHGSRAARRAGRLPVLFTEHDREMPAPWRHRVLHRWLARHVHHTAVVSANLAADLVRYEGFSPRRTASLVNGIPDPLARAASSRERVRALLVPDDAPVVLAVGSLTDVKNHAALIEAFAAVGDDRARLVIAGEGPLHDSLRACGDEHIPGRLTLLGRRDDVPDLLSAADVFVLPSHREGLPLCLVEAHAMSVPSVAFDVGGNGEVIADGQTGLLVPYPRMDAFVAAVSGLLAEPSRRLSYGEAARARFLARFTHSRMVAAYIALYDQLLAARVA